MKINLISAILAMTTIVASAATREISFVAELDKVPQSGTISWKRGESIHIKSQSKWNGSLLVVSNAQQYRLYMTTNNNNTVNFLPVINGYSTNRTEAHWTIESDNTLMPAQTYDFEGRALNTVDNQEISLFNIKVRVDEAPGSGSPAFSGPYNLKYAISTNRFSIFVSGGNTNVHQVAIGTDGQVPVSQNGTNIIWTTLSGSGGPETDPIWTAASNSYAQAINLRMASNTAMTLFGTKMDSNTVMALMSALANSNIFMTLIGERMQSNTVMALIGSRMDSNTVMALLAERADSNTFMNLISARIDSNTVMPLISQRIDSNTVMNLINVRADSNTFMNLISFRIDSNTALELISLRAESNIAFAAISERIQSNTAMDLLTFKLTTNDVLAGGGGNTTVTGFAGRVYVDATGGGGGGSENPTTVHTTNQLSQFINGTTSYFDQAGASNIVINGRKPQLSIFETVSSRGWTLQFTNSAADTTIQAILDSPDENHITVRRGGNHSFMFGPTPSGSGADWYLGSDIAETWARSSSSPNYANVGMDLIQRRADSTHITWDFVAWSNSSTTAHRLITMGYYRDQSIAGFVTGNNTSGDNTEFRWIASNNNFYAFRVRPQEGTTWRANSLRTEVTTNRMNVRYSNTIGRAFRLSVEISMTNTATETAAFELHTTGNTKLARVGHRANAVPDEERDFLISPIPINVGDWWMVTNKSIGAATGSVVTTIWVND